MHQAPSPLDVCWPDGTPRSQGNAFAVLYRARSAPSSPQPRARRRVSAERGRALPFSLPGTRVRNRGMDAE